MSKRKYDSTIARIAGNILSGFIPIGEYQMKLKAQQAVALARAIVAEVERTELDENLKENLNG
jgi:hypothetical protein